MKVAFYMNCVSTHQLPLAREVAQLVGSENFRYIDAGLGGQAYQSAMLTDSDEVKVISVKQADDWLENADLMLTGLRDLDTVERRADKGFKTYYYSERWFKPIGREFRVLSFEFRVGVAGLVRMIVPSYRRMVKRFVKWANTDPNARILAIGPWAKKDFLQMGVEEEKIVDWGYFVAPSTSQTSRTSRTSQTSRSLRVLWAGRDIPLKHVKDIERAIAIANKHLTSTLQLPLSTTTTPITFTKLTGVTPADVRKAMREHDTFVFASNGFEGWGAVVSEALEEGMNAIGTYECGAPPTLLPPERLFHCGDIKALARLLEAEYRGTLPPCSIGDWTAKSAAKILVRNLEHE